MTFLAAHAAQHADFAIGIAIGGLAISLRTNNSEYAAMLRQRYANFLCPTATARHCFDVTIIPPAACPDDVDVAVARVGEQWQMSRGDFTATWKPTARRGRITQSANPYSTDSLIRIVHSLALATTDGFLLHAASAIRGNRAFLFSGISGSGKTTIARLAPRDAIYLTDEISYVRLVDGRYTAFGTPFTGELNMSGANAAAPVAALYFLKQGTEHRINPIPPELALRKLLRNILFFAADSALTAQVFQVACAFISALPASELIFRPDNAVWELLT
jgi:hypothetical protein